MKKEVEQPKKKRATVSVAIIAKNEAATITPTIQSVRRLVDEIIVLVDDKTTDDTFKLAESAGADIVEQYTWKDDFATARNEVIAKCTKDWILIIDAHEVIHPKSGAVLTALMERVLPGKDLNDTEVFSGNIYMDPTGDTMETMVPTTFLMQPRLFKNNGMHSYSGRAHNHLVSKPECTGVRRPVSELVFVHKRTSENDAARRKQRIEMNIPRLKDDIKDEPKNPRPYFYLANTYYEMKDYENAEKYYNEYLEISSWKQERGQALLMLSAIYAERKDYEKAQEVALKALCEHWERAEFRIMLGDIAINRGLLYEAEHWYKSACDMKPPVTSGMFLRGPDYTYMPFAKLAAVYSDPKVQELFKAYTNGEKAIELGYPNPDLKEKLIMWKQAMSLKPNTQNVLVLDENGTFTFMRGICAELKKTVNVATAQIYDREQAEWADVIWFEWAAKNMLKASELPKKPGQKWIVRLNGYENYRPNIIQATQWDKVDVLIFGAKHTQDYFNTLYSIPSTVKQVHIPYGIDTRKWTYADLSKTESKNIGVVGILSEKKGPQLLAQTIRHFAKNHPEYKFLLRIDVLEKPSMPERHLHHMIKDLDNWVEVPHVENLDDWMGGLKYLISTSTLESFSYVVGEALTKGIKVLIHDWVGARDIWPESLIWKDFDELDDILESPYDSKAYRQYIIDNYTIEKAVNSIKNIIGTEKV